MTRRGALTAWLLPVVFVHLLLANGLAGQLAALEGAGTGRGLQRLQAEFVAELIPAAPAQLAPRPLPRRSAAQAAAAPPAPPASAASAASAAPAASATDPPQLPSAEPTQIAAVEPELLADPPVAAGAPPPAAETATADAPVPAAAAAASESESAPARSALEWPLSTRLDYRLTGNYRGPVDGQASVQWLLQGTHYQVHVEVSVGPSFAPLLSRRMSSDGVIGDAGLSPRRYEEETRVALRAPRRLDVELGVDSVRLATGEVLQRPPGVQDAASQFVQLTWLFTTQPQRLRRGESVPLTLALPRRVDPWIYDVLEHETLATPAGAFEVVHVQPRRPARPSTELSAEVWLAPRLQFLPVRIRIRQDEETWIDLLLQRLPRQTAAPAAPAAAAASDAR